MLWGDVATVRFKLTVPEGDISWEVEEELYQLVAQSIGASDFVQKVQDAAIEYLGSEFQVRITIGRGSIEIAFIVAALGMVFKAVKDYPDFIKGLSLLASHMQRLIDDRLGSIVGDEWVSLTQRSLEPGPALFAADTLASFQNVTNQLRNFLIYIAVTTSTLLVCVVALFLVLLL